MRRFCAWPVVAAMLAVFAVAVSSSAAEKDKPSGEPGAAPAPAASDKKSPPAAQPPADPFARWEKEIASLEARDAKEKPAAGGLLFAGSSTIRLWSLADSFAELHPVNHGFGGSQMADLVHFFDRLVLPLKPRTVVVYEGDNDLASGKKPQQVASDFQAFVKRFREALPESRLVILAVKPSPSRWKLCDLQRETNRLVSESVKDDARIKFLDFSAALLDEKGQPKPEYYKDDKLHLSSAGYEVVAHQLKPLLLDSAWSK